MTDRDKRKRTAVVQEWNRQYPIGTAVRYWTGAREGQGKTGLTSSEAFLLAGHTPVVLIDNTRGCIALTHVEPIGQSSSPSEPAIARCPKCRRTRDVSGYADGGYYCHGCKAEFDSSPDEGGDYDDRDPSRRLEREEARRERR